MDPTGERETYHYDGQGRLIRRTDRNGVTVELGYNLYGAPLFKKEKDGAQGDFYEYTPEAYSSAPFPPGCGTPMSMTRWPHDPQERQRADPSGPGV